MGVVPPQISVCLSELSRAQGGLWMLWAMHIHLKKMSFCTYTQMVLILI